MKILVVENTMGQGIIRTALQNLGGKATKTEIVQELHKLKAAPCLDKLVTDRLNKMHKRYEVDKVQDKKSGDWYYQLTQE